MLRLLLAAGCLVLGSLSAEAANIACGAPYIVKLGDNLTKLAREAYGSGRAWYVIYNANQQVIGNNASLIQPGQAFKIPCLNLQDKGPSLEKVAAGVAAEVRVLCSRELTTYCADVAPGGGRVLACFAAHEDKLSPACEFALYNSASTLERTAVVADFLVSQCASDVANYCQPVQPGQGRLLNCLKLHGGKLTPNCRAAVSMAEQ